MDIGVVITIGFITLLLGSLIGLLVYRIKKEKNRVKLKCSACGKVASIVISQNCLAHIMPGGNYEESGYLNTSLLAMYRTPVEDLIIGKQGNYSCCEKCGYFEKLNEKAPNKANQL